VRRICRVDSRCRQSDRVCRNAASTETEAANVNIEVVPGARVVRVRAPFSVAWFRSGHQVSLHDEACCLRSRSRCFLEGIAELDFGTGEAEALWLARDLETAAVPLHDVVIADDALVDKATDTAEIFKGRAPGLFGFSRSAAEATIVVGKEAAQNVVGGGQIGGAREAEFTGKAILKSAPQALDATLGLRAVAGM
jgi:hypothetical protein